MKNITYLILLIFFTQVVNSQTRIYSNEFLALGTGARALSMSGSVTASSSDVHSAFWNVAGLASAEKKYEVAAMHAEYFAGIAKYDNIGISYKKDENTTLGATILRFGIDNIPNTLELIDENGNVDYSRITRFSVADYALLLSYAKKSKIEGLQYGANVKIIYRNIGKFANAYGFGFDVASIYTKNKWKYGVALRDASSTFNAWFFDTSELTKVYEATGNELPKNGLEISLPKLLVGVAREFSFSETINMLVELDADFTFGNQANILINSKFANIDPHMGIELDYKKIVFLRTGVGNFAIIPDFEKKQFAFQPTVGLGVKIRNLKIDYALTDIGNQSIALYSNIFSLSYSF